MTKQPVLDKWVPIVCVLSPLFTFLSDRYSEDLINYEFGFELLILNGIYTMLGLGILTLLYKNKN